MDLRGGTGPYGLRVVSGELPEGLRVSSQRLSGTPTEKGNYTFTLEATDANLSSKVQQYTLNVGTCRRSRSRLNCHGQRFAEPPGFR
ncbi:Ig domain-containing protein [Deinococcus radiophilus]|uniref:Ig domain-containing protein n=1 Tax=Deinococcus radiophilus TaxID=32062 RepID=UPI00360B5720